MQSDEEHFDTSLRDLFGMVLHSSKTNARSLQSTERSFVSDYRIRKAIKLFHEQPAKDLDLNDVARTIGLSRSQFYERFRLCTGLSPGTYLDTLCCERAALLLSDPSVTIAEISDRIGFSAQGHFTRFFKAKTGVPPKSFRMGHIEAGRILK
jgi:AraC-like DNA-binding protein